MNLLGDDAEERKQTPIYSGFVRNFPLAMAAVSRLSYKGSRQHDPDAPTQWDRSKSGDELDAMMRHLVEGDWAAVAWRAMANLQKEEERRLDDEKCISVEAFAEDVSIAPLRPFLDCVEPYLNIPAKLSNFLWVFGKPTHGDTYLTYSTEGHGVERELHRGVAMVGPELEGLRWVLVAE